MIARHLAPNGVAYVSYNLFPGCRVRQIVWDMLKFHTRECPDLPSKLAGARSLIALMADSEAPTSSSEEALRAEFRKLAAVPDGKLLHDDLYDSNHPVYFQEFVGDAASSRLAFLVESEPGDPTSGDFAPGVRKMLERMDRLAAEQYVDFLHLRSFRGSLLCHATALPGSGFRPDRVASMHASPALALRRARAAGQSISYGSDDTRMVVECLLARWPGNVPTVELATMLGDMNSRAGGTRPNPMDAHALLAELWRTGVVDLRPRAIVPASGSSARPLAFAPARWTVRDSDVVPNLYHEGIQLGDPVARKLVTLLDGTRTRADLMSALGEACAGPGGARQLDAAIVGLAQKAMLVA
ncbi:MAG TPA: methyltransferase regulatory domain-containing protein [Casimicrobiaceae bacterium]|nr:methyltransferase regulatory domain-containing protein [Casimicrobiaceae bacterium]